MERGMKRTFCKITSLVLGLTVGAELVSANELDEWKAFQQQEQAAFKDFQSEHDKLFVRFLNQHWQEFALFQGKVRDVEPKPAKAPTVKNWLFDSEKPPSAPARLSKEQHTVAGSSSNRLFFGQVVQDLNMTGMKIPDLKRPSNQALADVWNQASKVDNSALLDQLRNERTALGLGDWGLYLYLNQQLAHHYSDTNQRTAYIWFLMNKLGYRVKVSFDQQSVYLLIAARNTIYGKTFVEIDGTTFYLLGQKTNRSPLYSYPGHYDQSSQLLNVNFERVLKGANAQEQRSLQFFDGVKKQVVNVAFDRLRSDLLQRYPQIDLIHYFQAQPSPSTALNLRQVLQPLISNYNDREAINFLLRLAQTGFKYATDDDQFGEENYLLIEESLNFPANDCEDRSIFLAWLIRDLLKLEVVALDYPGHVALAVNIPARANDATVTSQGKHYVVTDPTYIGAQAGMAMPSVRHVSPKVLHF